MTNSRYNAHTQPLFSDHKILPLNQILKQGRLIFMHSIFYNYAPKSFANVWVKNDERDLDIVLRNNSLFKIPQPRTESFKRFPLYLLATEWNNSGDLIFYENQITFRHALRDKLFEEIIN